MTTRCLGAAQLGLLGSRAPLTPFSHRPFSLARRSRRSLVAVPRAEEGNAEPNVEPTEQPKRRKRRNKKKQEFSLDTINPITLGRKTREAVDDKSITLDTFNPISMGRKSREVFDDVWAQLQRLGAGARGMSALDDFQLGIGGEFEAPQAPDTLVLVAGATGRVGRILVRKLLLRGYKVRALVRGKEGVEESLPQSVQLVYGDLADYKSCRKAVQGVDKVLCCAGARTTLTAELSRVEQQGVVNLVKAFLDSRASAARRAESQQQREQQQQQNGTAASSEQQQQQNGASASAEQEQQQHHHALKPAGSPQGVGKVEVVDFKREFYHEFWDIEKVGVPESEGNMRRRVFDRGQDRAEAYINEEDNLVFTGSVYSRGGIAQVGAKLVSPFGVTLKGTEGLLVNYKGDGNSYTMLLSTGEGQTYSCKFTTPNSYGHVRLPYDTFLPLGGAPALDPAAVTHMSIRYEPRQAQPAVVTGMADDLGSPFDRSAHSFNLEIDWIKALPGGQETDFVLVSCAGRRPDLSEAPRQKLVQFKGRAEDTLRNSGLGYTIVRPGPLKEEAGGYKALVFDQGNRIRQGISCADVADVCLKALHDPLARNKTFEVCWEYTPEAGLEQYELVAHLPDKSNNYLTPALATLRRNT